MLLNQVKTIVKNYADIELRYSKSIIMTTKDENQLGVYY